MKYFVPFIIIIISIISLSCSDFLLDPSNNDPTLTLWDQIRRGNFADAEAEHAALWLSGELMAPEDLYNEIRDGLKLLRDTWSDSIPEVNTKVLPAYNESGVSIVIPDSLKTRLLNGTWNEFDSLNTLYHLDTVKTYYSNYYNTYSVYVFLEGRLNSDVLKEKYEQVINGASQIHGRRSYFNYDIDNLYVWKANGELTFLIKKTIVDDGMYYQYKDKYWYFQLTDGIVRFIGYYNPAYHPKPEWWNEAKIPHDKFSKHYVRYGY